MKTETEQGNGGEAGVPSRNLLGETVRYCLEGQHLCGQWMEINTSLIAERMHEEKADYEKEVADGDWKCAWTGEFRVVEAVTRRFIHTPNAKAHGMRAYQGDKQQ